MRTWGRVIDETGHSRWVEVTETAYVWLVTLVQCLRMVRGESPFWGNYGIPAQQSVLQQVFPDFYVALTQQQFAQYFAALTVARVPDVNPVYQVNVTMPDGTVLQTDVFTLPPLFTLDESNLDSNAVLG